MRHNRDQWREAANALKAEKPSTSYKLVAARALLAAAINDIEELFLAIEMLGDLEDVIEVNMAPTGAMVIGFKEEEE